MSDTKRPIRGQCLQIRESLGEAYRLQASQAICRQVEAWPVFKRARTVLAYLPMRGEVDLRPLLERHRRKRWALPRILPQGGMVFHPYDPRHLTRHAFGMLEPDPYAPVVPAEEIQLVLVPGVAFDRHGWRLGYGGGYFDRFLATYSGVTLGVTYQALILDQLPHTRHDVRVHYVVTEEGIMGPSA